MKHYLGRKYKHSSNFSSFQLCANIRNEWLLNILFLSLDSLYVDDEDTRQFHYQINFRAWWICSIILPGKGSELLQGVDVKEQIYYTKIPFLHEPPTSKNDD